MIVDYLHSTYSFNARLHAGSDQVTRCRWVVAQPDAQNLPYPTFMGSPVWDDSRVPPPTVLGDTGDPHTWVRKAVSPFPGNHFEGQPAWFTNGIPPGQCEPAMCVDVWLPSRADLLGQVLAVTTMGPCDCYSADGLLQVTNTPPFGFPSSADGAIDVENGSNAALASAANLAGDVENGSNATLSSSADGATDVEATISLPTPGTIAPGLVAWWNAGGVAPGSTPATVADLSGAGNNLTAFGTTNPVVVVNPANGLNAFQLNGSNQYFRSAALGSLFSGTSVPLSVWFVGSSAVLDSAQRAIFILSQSSGAGSDSPTFDWFRDAFRGQMNSDHRTDAAVETAAFGGGLDTALHVMVLTFDGSLLSMYIDHVLVYRVTVPSGAMTVDQMVFGAHLRTGVLTDPWDGLFQDWGVYDTGLTPGQEDALATLMDSLYGTTPGTPVWLPDNIAGLMLWARDDSWDYPSPGVVSNWYSKLRIGTGSWDLAGGGTYTTNAINGLAGATMNGTSELWDSGPAGSVFAGTNTPWFVAGTFSFTALSVNGVVWQAGNLTLNNPFIGMYLLGGAGPTYQVYFFRRDDSGTNVDLTTGVFVAPGPHNFYARFDGSDLTLWIDGVQVYGPTSFTVGSTTTDEFAFMGNFHTATGTDFMPGIAGEIMVGSPVPTSAQETSLLNYQLRWGIG